MSQLTKARLITPAANRAGPAHPLGAPAALRIVVLAAGWTLFGYWWSLALVAEGAAALGSMLLQMSAGVIGITLIGVLWIRHNLRIARRGRRGHSSLYRPIRHERDHFHRPLILPPEPLLHSSRLIRVEINGDGKHYVAIALPVEISIALPVGISNTLSVEIS